MSSKQKVRTEASKIEEEEVFEDSEGLITRTWRKILLSIRNNVVRPFFIGASGAFGVSVGYALFDFTMKNLHRFPFYNRLLPYTK